jgi:hypothetical protein
MIKASGVPPVVFTLKNLVFAVGYPSLAEVKMIDLPSGVQL